MKNISNSDIKKTCGGCVYSKEMPQSAENDFYMQRWCDIKVCVINLFFQEICDKWKQKWK